MLRKINIHKWPVVFAVAIFAACSYGGDDSLPAPGEPGRGTEKEYGIKVGASSGLPETRASYDGVTYKWGTSERIGMYMLPAGTTASPIFGNVSLVSTNESASTVTDFKGSITGTQMSLIGPAAKYDYYSYYPYDAANDEVTFPNVRFEIPATLDLTPDVFPVKYGFMVADKVSTGNSERPISYIEGGEQQFGKNVEFRYKHAFAYLEVYLALNLMSQPVNKIVITSPAGTSISGMANIDITTGKIGFPSGSNTLTVNIINSNGLDIWQGANGVEYNRIWIPINPDLADKQFTFEFFSAQGASSTVTMAGGTLKAGMKHKVAMKVPFHVNFVDINPRPDDWSPNWSFINHKGYGFRRWEVNMAHRGGGLIFNPFSGGTIVFDNSDGVLFTPEIKTVNSLGLTGVRVKVTYSASGNAILTWFTGERQMRYGITNKWDEVFLGTVELAMNEAKYYTFNGTVTPDKPHVVFKANTDQAYYIWMQEITVEYAP
jgi:hypothetical protein